MRYANMNINIYINNLLFTAEVEDRHDAIVHEVHCLSVFSFLCLFDIFSFNYNIIRVVNIFYLHLITNEKSNGAFCHICSTSTS